MNQIPPSPTISSQIKHDLFTREYNLGDLLALAWQLFSENFKTILLVTLVVYIPIGLITIAIPAPSIDSANPASIWQSSFSTNFFVSMLLVGLVGILVPLAIAAAIRQQLDGKIIDYRTALKLAVSKWWVAIITSLLMGLCVLGLSLLLVIPGIIFAFYWSFTAYIVILNNKSGMEAMNYSRSVVKHRWWKVFGYLIAFAFLSGIVSSIINLPLAKFSDHLAVSFVSTLLSNIIFSYVSVASVIFFLNLEANKVPQINSAPPSIPQ